MSRTAALSRARYILPMVREDYDLPREPPRIWRCRDHWDMRLTLECWSAVFDRTWKRVEVNSGR